MMTTPRLEETVPSTVNIVGVKVRDRGEVKKMGSGSAALAIGSRVMLEFGGDLTYGVVYTPTHPMPFIPPMRIMKSILRRATPEDEAAIERHALMVREGTAYCRDRAASLGLRMKLVEVYGSFRRLEMTFVYTAEGRVDFRQLVKDLARRFGGRIEMRQIGTREEARRLGGVDTCGRVLCCASFMTDFTPVGIKKAKYQGMDLKENRRIGVCGRLKCCLMFETMDADAAPPALVYPSRR